MFYLKSMIIVSTIKKKPTKKFIIVIIWIKRRKGNELKVDGKDDI